MTPRNSVFIRTGILLPLFVLLLFSNASSQALGTWAFNGSTAGTPGSYNTVSNADFSPSVTSKGYSGSVYYGEMNWSTGTINTNDYFQFTLTPVAGYSLNILSVLISMRRSSTGSPAGSGPRSFSIRSSQDNYATDLQSGSLTHNITNYTMTPAGFNLLSSPVTFRVYGYNAANSSGGLNRLVFDNISVTGSNILLAGQHTFLSTKKLNGSVHVLVSIPDFSGLNTYSIERSKDAVNFKTANRIDPTKIVGGLYTFADIYYPNNTTKIYYRVRITKQDGDTQFSNIAIVDASSQHAKFKLYASGNTVNFSSDLTGLCTFTLSSSSGTCVCRKKIIDGAQINSLLLPNLPTGIYYGTLSNNQLVRTSVMVLP